MSFPLYELAIDENKEAFVEAIALVENPAIESNFIASSTTKHYAFNEEKMELLGAAMIPNQKIYRRNPDGYEYEVFFTTETIRKISQLFFKKGFQANLNIEHDTEVDADSYVFQSYIVDTAKGMLAPMGLEAPDGTWIVGVKVQNKAVWEDIKTGKRKGFSVEGVFELIKHDFNTHINEEAAELELLLQELKQFNQLLEKSSI